MKPQYFGGNQLKPGMKLSLHMLSYKNTLIPQTHCIFARHFKGVTKYNEIGNFSIISRVKLILLWIYILLLDSSCYGEASNFSCFKWGTSGKFLHFWLLDDNLLIFIINLNLVYSSHESDLFTYDWTKCLF